MCNFGRGYYEEQFCEIILNLSQWFRRRCRFTYLELWRPFCLVERNHLCIFERRHYGEHSCEVISNLDQWFRRRRRLKKFTDHGQRPITIAHLEPSAQVS